MACAGLRLHHTTTDMLLTNSSLTTRVAGNRFVFLEYRNLRMTVGYIA